MPLLKRREFKQLKPPDDLDLEEEVFVCRLTNELFRDYDDFFKRTILCNSLVWSCSLTGKPGLTYQEALESEERAQKLLASFPVYLEPPVLYLVTQTRRGRLADMCDDVFVFVRDRFFVGEIVDVNYKGKRETCRVMKVIPPGNYSKDNAADSPADSNGNVTDDEIMIVDEEGQVTEKVVFVKDQPPVMKTPRVLRPKTLTPSSYKYEVLSLQGAGKYKVPADKVSRKKGLYTRDKNKLYLKQNCRISDSFWGVKPEVVQKFQIYKRNFDDFFAGPPPNFKSTPAKRNRGDSTREADDDDDLPLTEVKRKNAAKLEKQNTPDRAKGEKIKKKKEKQRESVSPKDAKIPKISPEEREAMKQKMKEEKEKMKQQRVEEKMKERLLLKQQKDEERLAKREEMKKAADEEKEKRRQEREKQKIEKRQRDEFMKEWNKPRDDLECDDLKDLPEPHQVKCRIPQDLFGEAVMLMEFMHSFGDELGVKDEFPDGIALDVIEEAIFSHQVEGPLFDLLKLLLFNIFHLQDEEEEDEKVDLKEHAGEATTVDLADILNEDDPTYSALSKAASQALVWPQIHQGTPLRNLPLESTTISEVLRLHLLASGAETSVMDARWRYQQRGAYTFHDDPGLELRLKEPGILKALTIGNVFDLTADAKMKILHTLTNQILTYVTMRDIIEDSWDQWQVTKREYKELCRQERHREREEAASKWKRKMEERARAQTKLIEEQKKAQERFEEEKRAKEKLQLDAATAAGHAAAGAAGPAEEFAAGTIKPGENAKGEDEVINLDSDDEMETSLSATQTKSPEEEEAAKKAIEKEEEKKRIQDEKERLKEEQKRLEEEKESAEKKAEFIKKRDELRKELTEVAPKYSITPVGLDRVFRKFWVFNSLPGVFVEQDKELMEALNLSLENSKVDSLASDCEKKEEKETVDQNSSGVSDDSNKENRDSSASVPGEVKKEREGLAVVENGQESMVNGTIEIQPDAGIKLTLPVQPTGEVLNEDLKSEESIKEEISESKDSVVNGNMVEEVKPATPDLLFSPDDQSLWGYYETEQELESLLNALNNRGFRESALKGSITQELDKIKSSLDRFPSRFMAGIYDDEESEGEFPQKAMPSSPRQVVVKMTSGKKGLVSNQADGDETLELLLREAILDLEDRLWQGGLGIIKVDNRNKWIGAIEQGSYERQSNEISWGPLWARSLLDDSDFLDMSIAEPPLLEDTKKVPAQKFKDRVAELKKLDTLSGSPSSTRCSTPTNADFVVRDMACALLQISQGLHEKYLIKPIGVREEVKRGTTRVLKKTQEEEEEEDKQEEEGEKKPKKSCRECWEESLMASNSLSQVFLHLSTLERSILWSKSILNARCRICRRKGDAEAMLLCDNCDRGHHMYCLKPPLKHVPKGDWFCKDCTPKEKKRSPRKARRSTFEEEQEEKEDEEVEVDEEDDEDAEEAEVEEEEEEEDDEIDETAVEEEEEEDSDEEQEENVSEEGGDADTSQHSEVCCECGHGGKLLFCKTCQVAVHRGCASSKSRTKEWQCDTCKEKPAKKEKSSKAIQKQKGQDVKGSKGKATTSQTKGSRSKSQSPPNQRSGRHPRGEDSRRGRTVHVDEEVLYSTGAQVSLNISDDGSRLSTVQVVETGKGANRGKKRTRSAEEDADTEEEDDLELKRQKLPSRRQSLTVVLTKRDKEIRKFTADDAGEVTTSSTSGRRRSSLARGSIDMQQIVLCEQLLKELVRHEEAGPFMVPVSKKAVPDYYKIIRRPMDFSTMQSKLSAMQYVSAIEFIADARLIFTNCQQYNRYQSYEAKKGRKMWAFLEEKILEYGIQTDSFAKRKSSRNSESPQENKRIRRQKVVTDM